MANPDEKATMSSMADVSASEVHTEERRSCLQCVKDALSLVPKDATPPDWGILWLVFISLFSSAFTLTFLFPFLPEMVLTFGYSETEKGTYVGLIASSVFAGRAVGSFFWGWLTDVKGRRLVLLCTIFGNGVFSFLFGFTHSLSMAMLLRFLAGLANGTVGTAKTILYDVSDNTNQAFSMSMISVAWGSGLILGPTLGGYLALPADKYPSTFSAVGFFGTHPFILPSLCCLIVCAISFLIVFFKFEEPAVLRNQEIDLETSVPESADTKKDKPVGDTNAKSFSNASAHYTSQPLLDRLRLDSTHSGSKMEMSLENLHCESDMLYYYAQRESEKWEEEARVRQTRQVSKSMHDLATHHSRLMEQELLVPRKRSYSSDDQTKSLPIRASFQNSNLTASSDHHQRQGQSPPQVVVEMRETRGESRASSKDSAKHSGGCCLSRCWHSFRNSAFFYLLRQKDVRCSTALYTVFSFAVIGYEDVFTIFASTSIEYDGLGFSTDEIGTALGAVSIPLMFIQIKLYPMLVKKCGIKRAFLICMFFVFIPVQIIPILHLLVYQKVWLWVGIIFITLPQRIAANSCFAGSSLLINNSVTSEMAGKANGIGMTATAIARTLAPTLGGAMFAWSLKACEEYGPPIDVNITFVFFGFVLFISCFQCLFLPEHLDHQKK